MGAAARSREARPVRFALIGNPNTGKTTLFNRLCGIRAKTANFPGSTVEARIGHCTGPAGVRYELTDLPGIYSLALDLPESQLARDVLAGAHGPGKPEALLIVVDATNLTRNLRLVGQALRLGIPSIVALNMTDIAQKRGLTIDVGRLSEHLGCPVVPTAARSGENIATLISTFAVPQASTVALPDPVDAAALTTWAERIARDIQGGDHAVGQAGDTFTDRLDLAFTHPLLGLVIFAAVMTGLFMTIFMLASIPMDLIELLFGQLQTFVANVVPEGAIHDLLADGVVAGIAGTVVFLPQICLLFFLISLLEDTGYLARAAFVMDRLLRRFGLPGQAFVPLLSAHACAIPALMSTRLIPDRRDRIATILVAPLLSCSARLPVYVLLIGILFPTNALLAGLAFAGCYVLGAVAALITAGIFRSTLLKGAARPMVLELPSYKRPSLRTALLTTFDRAVLFLRKAGTVIVAISIVLWWLGSYPHTQPPAEAAALAEQAEVLRATDEAAAEELASQAGAIEARHATANSYVARIGRTIEPVLAPLGYDWQVSIGVLASFAAREVFVATMAVVVSGSDEGEDEELRERIASAKRDDGSPVFTTATSASLLVFYVLAMQCLPTLAVTRRETGSWKWAMLQLGYMSALAYVLALVVFNGLRLIGVS